MVHGCITVTEVDKSFTYSYSDYSVCWRVKVIKFLRTMFGCYDAWWTMQVFSSGCLVQYSVLLLYEIFRWLTLTGYIFSSSFSTFFFASHPFLYQLTEAFLKKLIRKKWSNHTAHIFTGCSLDQFQSCIAIPTHSLHSCQHYEYTFTPLTFSNVCCLYTNIQISIL